MTATRPQAGDRWWHVLGIGVLSFALPGFGQTLKGSPRLGLMVYVIITLTGLAAISATWLIAPTPSTMVLVIATLVLSSLARLAFAIQAGLLRSRPANEPILKGKRLAQWTLGLCLVLPQLPVLAGYFVTPLAYGWLAYAVYSGSMEPSLVRGEYVFIDRRSAGALPKRGEIVLFPMQTDPPYQALARVVATEGDRVQLRRSILYLNGKPVPRRYVGDMPGNYPGQTFHLFLEAPPGVRPYGIVQLRDDGMDSTTPEYLVPPAHVFLLGDNRDDSIDSRFMDDRGWKGVGFVPVHSLQGVARLIYWSDDSSRILSDVR